MNDKMDPEYSEYLNHIEILPEKELKQCFKRYYKTHNEEDFNKIFNSLQKLAVKYAYTREEDIKNISSLDFMDLVQEGLARLCEYIRKETYDPNKDISPSTYFQLMLVSKVSGLIYTHSFPVKMPAGEYHKIVKNYKVRKAVEEGKTEKEISKEFGMTKKEIHKELDSQKSLPGSQSLYDGKEDEDGHFTYLVDRLIIEDENTPEKEVIKDEFYNKLQEILTDEEYKIVISRFIEGWELTELESRYKLSRKEINSLIKSSKEKIKPHLKELQEIL